MKTTKQEKDEICHLKNLRSQLYLCKSISLLTMPVSKII